VKKIGTLLGRTIQVKNEKVRARPAGSEVDRLLADNTMARTLLKWKPKVTLDEGLIRTVDWIRENLHEFRKSEYGI